MTLTESGFNARVHFWPGVVLVAIVISSWFRPVEPPVEQRTDNKPPARSSRAAKLADAALPDGAPLSIKRVELHQVFDYRGSRFHPAQNLAMLWAAKGIVPTRPIVVCGKSLSEAAGLAFALELTGADNVRICCSGWE